MIESAHFDNVYGQHIEFNDLVMPMKAFSMEVETRSQDRAKGQQHGIWQGNTYFGKRVFHIEGDILCDSSAEYIAKRRELMRALMPRLQSGQKIAGVLSMTFTGMVENISVQCALDGYPEIPVEALAPGISPYQINFKAFDPRMYGGVVYSQTAVAPTSVTGRTYNKTYNKTYAAGLSGGDVTITNAGEIETYPQVTFYGPCTGPQLVLVRPEGNLLLSLSGLVLASGEWVQVDFNERIAVTNGGLDAYSYVSGTWWALEPGNNTVRFTAYSVGIGAQAVIQWRNAYML